MSEAPLPEESRACLALRCDAMPCPTLLGKLNLGGAVNTRGEVLRELLVEFRLARDAARAADATEDVLVEQRDDLSAKRTRINVHREPQRLCKAPACGLAREVTSEAERKDEKNNLLEPRAEPRDHGVRLVLPELRRELDNPALENARQRENDKAGFG